MSKTHKNVITLCQLVGSPGVSNTQAVGLAMRKVEYRREAAGVLSLFWCSLASLIRNISGLFAHGSGLRPITIVLCMQIAKWNRVIVMFNKTIHYRTFQISQPSTQVCRAESTWYSKRNNKLLYNSMSCVDLLHATMNHDRRVHMPAIVVQVYDVAKGDMKYISI